MTAIKGSLFVLLGAAAMAQPLAAQSCAWQDLQLRWPVSLDEAVRPGYGNIKGLFYVGNYVGFVNPADPNGVLIDYTGAKRGHNGIDIGVPSWRPVNDGGAKVVAAAAGVVVGVRDGIFDHLGPQVDQNAWRQYPPLQVAGVEDGSGNVVYLRHANGFVTQYAHLRKGLAKNFQLGQAVAEGELLGVAASSGASGGPHLHFGLYVGDGCLASRGASLVGGRVSSAQGPVWGYFVDPLQPGANGATMFKGTQGVDYPLYDHCSNAPADFQDLHVTLTDGFIVNPPPDHLLSPLHGLLRLRGETCGSTATTTPGIRVTSPGGVAKMLGWLGSNSTPLTETGNWTVQLGRTPSAGGAFEPRIARTVQVLGLASTTRLLGSFDSDLAAVRESGPETGVGGPVASLMAVGASGRVQSKGFVTFGTGSLAGKAIRHAVLRLRVLNMPGSSVGPLPLRNGLNPMTGWGWGGRLLASLRTGASGAIQASEFQDPAFLPAGEFSQVEDASTWTEAVLNPAALAQLASGGSARFRVEFEVPSVRTGGPDDYIVFQSDAYGQTGSYVPELVVYYDAAAGVPTRPLRTNVALGKTARQSGTSYGAAASRAVDGNVSGNWQDGSITHTPDPATSAEPFWDVDLGRAYDVSAIQIWARTDCCRDRTADLDVCTSALPFPGDSLAAIKAAPGVSCKYIQHPVLRSHWMDIERPARWVRIQSRGSLPAASRIVALAEVEVFGVEPKGGQLFSAANYGGTAQVLGSDAPSLGPGNDLASSLKIDSGWWMTLYEHDGHAGGALTFTKDEPNLAAVSGPCAGGKWDKCASSVKFVQPSGLTIAAHAGSGQTAVPGLAFATQLTARVTGEGGLPVHGVNVTFTAPAAGASGFFAGSRTVTVATGGDGLAVAAVFTAGNNATGSYTVTAAAAETASPASFTLTNSFTGTVLTVTGGNNQSTVAGTQFATPLEVTLTTAGGAPVPNQLIEFRCATVGAGCTLGDNTAILRVPATGANGKAAVTAFANAAATTNNLPYNATARVAADLTVAAAFALRNLPGPPASVQAFSGSGQSAQTGAAFTQGLRAQVKDALGNDVPNTVVTFTAPATGAGATLSSATANTGVDLENQGATVTATANSTAGSYNVTASVGNLSANFALTNTAGPPSGLKVDEPAAGQTIGTSTVTFRWSGQAAAARGFDLRITSGQTTVYTGRLAGGSTSSTAIGVPTGALTFEIRECLAADFTNCGPWVSRNFNVQLAAPTASPTITAPTAGQTLTESTFAFQWGAVAGADSYELKLINQTHGTTDLVIRVLGATGSIFSMRAGQYVMEVRACTAACGPPAVRAFTNNLPAAPTQPPAAPGVQVTNNNGQNQVAVTYDAVTGADLYRVQIVAPGAGPGGGALTVAARQTAATNLTLSAPNGAMVAFVQACNGNGCSPVSAGTPFNASFGVSNLPVVSSPVAGATVTGPQVLIAWNRIPGDDGTNTSYLVFAQDFSRQRPALNILTKSNFHGALFAPGRRYDVQVIANPGAPNQATGPASGFHVFGPQPATPTLYLPQHEGTVGSGNIQLSWTPLEPTFAQYYQYFVARLGEPNPTATGISSGTDVVIPLAVPAGQSARFSAIVRTCPAGVSCTADSDAGWLPWSNTPGGSGVTNFWVTGPPGP